MQCGWVQFGQVCYAMLPRVPKANVITHADRWSGVEECGWLVRLVGQARLWPAAVRVYVWRSSTGYDRAVAATAKLLAISDLHVAYDDNRAIVERLRPHNDRDWLIIAGDVGEMVGDVEWALSLLCRRFARVVWAPGNHELWTPVSDPVQLRGVARYDELVSLCRGLGVVTPEDPYPVWEPANEEPLRIVPLFLLYDYTFRPAGTNTKTEALQRAYDTGTVCTDEFLLHPNPYPTREAWCAARIEHTQARLDQLDDMRTVLVNHFPLTREPTRMLRFPEFAQWCGSVHTGDWHLRYRAAAVVYGHLHIPGMMWVDGVPTFEVSLGYPQEWRHRTGREPGTLTQIRPSAPATSGINLRRPLPQGRM